MVQIVIDASDLLPIERGLRGLAAGGVALAQMRAINRVGSVASTAARRALAKQTGVQYGAILGATRTVPWTQNTADFQLVAWGQHIGLVHFGARQGKRGVSARPWGKRRTFRGTFLAVPENVTDGSRQVFKRTGVFTIATKGTYKGQRREVIEKLWGPNVAVEMVRKDSPTPAAFEKVAGDALPARMNHELEWIMRQTFPVKK